MVTPELVTLVMAAIGIVSLLVHKSKCFVRHVDHDTDWGIGFTDNPIMPEVKTPHVRNRCGSDPLTTAADRLATVWYSTLKQSQR